MPDFPYYVPDFRILIGNVAINETMRRAITSVSLTTGLEGADRVEMVVANQARLWVDEPLFAAEPQGKNPFALELGYHPAPLVRLFEGEITGMTASFPASGVPQVTVTAQDKLHRTKKAKQSSWNQQPIDGGNKARSDEQVTAAVAQTHELQVKHDPRPGDLVGLVTAAAQLGLASDPDSLQKGVRRQTNQSDYDLLRKVARESGWEVVIDHQAKDGGKTVRFLCPWQHTSKEVELEYGFSLIEFTPKETLVGQVKSAVTNVRVSATGKKYGVSLEVNEQQSELTLKVTPDPAPAKKSDSTVVIDEPLTPSTAPRRLLGELLTRTNEKMTGSGSTIGDPRIRAGTVLCLTGLGVRFGGLYRVTSATHTIDSGGYKTRFDVRKEFGLNGVPKITQKATPLRKRPAASS